MFHLKSGGPFSRTEQSEAFNYCPAGRGSPRSQLQ
jgi:hypothetical protein